MIDWLKGWFDSQNSEKEINLLVYGAGMACSAVWLSLWFWRGPRDANLVAALGVFVAGITGGLFRKGSSQ